MGVRTTLSGDNRMRVTQKWTDWATRLTAVRLRQLIQQLDDQMAMFGQLDEVDSVMLKALSAEIERRY